VIHKIFSVRDNKADAFLPPFFLPNRAMAVRSFGECANHPSHQFCKHSTDYALFELGEFDDHSGMLDRHDTPEMVAVASSLKDGPPVRIVGEIREAFQRAAS